MDLRKLKTLIDLVSDSGISELEVSEGEDKVRIVNTRAGSSSHSQPSSAPNPIVLSAPVALESYSPEPIVASEGSVATQGFTQKSPMVGTFYRSPNPDFCQCRRYRNRWTNLMHH